MITYFHPAQLRHHPQSYLSRGQMRSPQEVPARAERLLEAVRALGFALHEPADAGMGPLARVHGADYLAFLADAHAAWTAVGEDWGGEVMSNIYVREPNPLRGVLAQAARYLADGSCPIGAETWQAAYWSAQCAVAAAEAVRAGAVEAYALCRPPGHHARFDAAGGFCYLKTPAIAAEVLRETYGRVLVLDLDVHHGQGVQEIFYRRGDVMYVSVHADPTNFYPVVAGFADEGGEGDGAGATLNLPMPHGASETDFFTYVAQALAAVRVFAPDALVFALGFDIYKDDPQSKVSVTTPGFARLGELIGGLALPTVIVQESGYRLETLAANAQAFFDGFARGRRPRALAASDGWQGG